MVVRWAPTAAGIHPTSLAFPEEKDLLFSLGLGLAELTWIMHSPLNTSLWSRGWNMPTGLAWAVWLSVPL